MTNFIKHIAFGLLAFSAMFVFICCAPFGQGERDGGDDVGKKKPNKELARATTKQCSEVAALAKNTALDNLAEIESRFLDAHNEIRAIYKLPAFTWDENLARYAQRWAEYLKRTIGAR